MVDSFLPLHFLVSSAKRNNQTFQLPCNYIHFRERSNSFLGNKKTRSLMSDITEKQVIIQLPSLLRSRFLGCHAMTLHDITKTAAKEKKKTRQPRSQGLLGFQNLKTEKTLGTRLENTLAVETINSIRWLRICLRSEKTTANTTW